MRAGFRAGGSALIGIWAKPSLPRLLALRPATLVIVACDPATLARDLAVLAPGYEIAAITLVDLFPQTFHMETIVKLEARK